MYRNVPFQGSPKFTQIWIFSVSKYTLWQPCVVSVAAQKVFFSLVAGERLRNLADRYFKRLSRNVSAPYSVTGDPKVHKYGAAKYTSSKHWVPFSKNKPILQKHGTVHLHAATVPMYTCTTTTTKGSNPGRLFERADKMFYGQEFRTCPTRRNRSSRTRRRMHLCMPDDQNGRKIKGVPSAAMARLTPSIITKKYILAANGLVLSSDGNPTMNLPCYIYKG
jgi:hypothetical protein